MKKGTTKSKKQENTLKTSPEKKERSPVPSPSKNQPVDSIVTTTKLPAIPDPRTDREKDENNLVEAYQSQLEIEIEKREAMEAHMNQVLIQSRFKLEASLEDIKHDFNTKVADLTLELEDIYNAQNKSSSKKKGFDRKAFTPQESLLSKMLNYNDENYKTIFNLSVVTLLLWGFALAYDDYEMSGRLNYDLLLWGIVRDIGPFFQNWIMMFLYSFLVIPFSHWAGETQSNVLFYTYITIYTILQLLLFAFSGYIVNCHTPRFAMPLAIGFMAEQSRISMKMHSYFREKILWKRFNEKYASRPKSKGSILGLPLPEINYLSREVSMFTEYIFMPTLVYRERYPRTARVRWDFVIMRFLELAALVYYAFLIFRVSLPQLEMTAGKPISFVKFSRLSFSCMGPCMAIMFLTHYMVLHTVQNIGAEVTRFADREFYQDWWTARTFSVFYRKWNGVVHDFIHSYLYMDLVELAHFSKLSSLLSAFIISAIVHEYILCFSMGFFLPVLGLLFTGPGLIFILLTKNKTGRLWNIFMWMMLAIGNSWLMVIYVREFYSRTKYNEANSLDDLPEGFVKNAEYLGYNDFVIPLTFRLQYPSYFSNH